MSSLTGSDNFRILPCVISMARHDSDTTFKVGLDLLHSMLTVSYFREILVAQKIQQDAVSKIFRSLFLFKLQAAI